MLSKNDQSFFAAAFLNNKLFHFHTAEEADKTIQFLKNKTVVIDDVSEENTKEPPPLLYDLSKLQQDANKRYGLSAEQTLNAAQDLYEKKLITYPRTGSQYIGEDVFETIPDLIESISSYLPFAKQSSALIGKKLSTRSVNGSKVTDHHALLPTENKVSQPLSGNHEIVYNLIVARLLESFSDYCIKLVTTAFFKVEDCNYDFVSKGVLIIQQGWRGVLNIEEEEKNQTQQLPKLNIKEILPILKAESIKQKTKPKPLFTEGTLLQAMETCGKEIENEELRLALKDCGLGTPATRAATIETLFTRQYIERQKKSLIPTSKGLAVYELVKDKKISQPLLTGEWEKKLEEIKESKETSLVDEYMSTIQQYTDELTIDLLSVNNSSISTGVFLNGFTKYSCPKCNKGNVVIREKAAGCSEYKSGCDFAIWRTIAGKQITDKNIESLLEKGKTIIIKGFKKKNGGIFDAGLQIGKNFKTEFILKNN
jgi:DNA topoisomerase-3